VRILINGRIRTMNPSLPHASALAIQDGKIIAAGNNAEIMAIARSSTPPENLDGKTVWPGLTDAHIHLQQFAASLDYIDCETGTLQEMVQRVANKARTTPPGRWIRGHGWNQNRWPEGYGTASLLDVISPSNPVYLTAKSLHAAWANSLALNQAGITDQTPDPEGGTIQRDAECQPTGILLESAVGLIENVIPQPSIDEIIQQLAKTQALLWQYGLTGVHDFDGPQCFEALQILQASGRLRLRVVKNLPVDVLKNAIAVGLQSGFGNDFLRIGSIKCFSDGALGPRTAAMLDPYEGDASYTGQLLMSEDEIVAIGRQAVEHGLSLAIHAIGDRANRTVLDAFAKIRQIEKQKGLPFLRHRIEHVQILHPQDFPRFANLGIVASVQPVHATSDMEMADRHWGDRSATAYAYRTLAVNGASMAFGSDAPVESPNPFLGLHAAVTRRCPDGQPGLAGWHPEQKLSLDEALNRFTVGPAFATNQEKRLGRLTPGYLADLIVMDRDPYQIPPEEIYAIQPAAVMVGGEWVWERRGL
jgi:predicted amidohydrolase YtcJ